MTRRIKTNLIALVPIMRQSRPVKQSAGARDPREPQREDKWENKAHGCEVGKGKREMANLSTSMCLDVQT